MRKGEAPDTCYGAAYTSHTHHQIDQKHFTISEVTANWLRRTRREAGGHHVPTNRAFKNFRAIIKSRTDTVASMFVSSLVL